MRKITLNLDVPGKWNEKKDVTFYFADDAFANTGLSDDEIDLRLAAICYRIGMPNKDKRDVYVSSVYCRPVVGEGNQENIQAIYAYVSQSTIFTPPSPSSSPSSYGAKSGSSASTLIQGGNNYMIDGEHSGDAIQLKSFTHYINDQGKEKGYRSQYKKSQLVGQEDKNKLVREAAFHNLSILAAKESQRIRDAWYADMLKSSTPPSVTLPVLQAPASITDTNYFQHADELDRRLQTDGEVSKTIAVIKDLPAKLKTQYKDAVQATLKPVKDKLGELQTMGDASPELKKYIETKSQETSKQFHALEAKLNSNDQIQAHVKEEIDQIFAKKLKETAISDALKSNSRETDFGNAIAKIEYTKRAIVLAIYRVVDGYLKQEWKSNDSAKNKELIEDLNKKLSGIFEVNAVGKVLPVEFFYAKFNNMELDAFQTVISDAVSKCSSYVRSNALELAIKDALNQQAKQSNGLFSLTGYKVIFTPDAIEVAKKTSELADKMRLADFRDITIPVKLSALIAQELAAPAVAADVQRLQKSAESLLSSAKYYQQALSKKQEIDQLYQKSAASISDINKTEFARFIDPDPIPALRDKYKVLEKQLTDLQITVSVLQDKIKTNYDRIVDRFKKLDKSTALNEQSLKFLDENDADVKELKNNLKKIAAYHAQLDTYKTEYEGYKKQHAPYQRVYRLKKQESDLRVLIQTLPAGIDQDAVLRAVSSSAQVNELTSDAEIKAYEEEYKAWRDTLGKIKECADEKSKAVAAISAPEDESPAALEQLTSDGIRSANDAFDQRLRNISAKAAPVRQKIADGLAAIEAGKQHFKQGVSESLKSYVNNLNDDFKHSEDEVARKKADYNAIAVCQVIANTALNHEYWNSKVKRGGEKIKVDGKGFRCPRSVYGIIQIIKAPEYANWHSDGVQAQKLYQAIRGYVYQDEFLETKSTASGRYISALKTKALDANPSTVSIDGVIADDPATRWDEMPRSPVWYNHDQLAKIRVKVGRLKQQSPAAGLPVSQSEPEPQKPGFFARVGGWIKRHPIIFGGLVAFSVVAAAAAAVTAIVFTGGAATPIIGAIVAGVKTLVATVGVAGTAALGAGLVGGTVALGGAIGGLVGAASSTGSSKKTAVDIKPSGGDSLLVEEQAQQAVISEENKQHTVPSVDKDELLLKQQAEAAKPATVVRGSTASNLAQLQVSSVGVDALVNPEPASGVREMPNDANRKPESVAVSAAAISHAGLFSATKQDSEEKKIEPPSKKNKKKKSGASKKKRVITFNDTGEGAPDNISPRKK